MSYATNRSVEGDKLTGFLQHTLGGVAESYMLNLSELSCLKEEKHQREQLGLKQDLKAKDNELAALRKKLEKAEANLVLANTKNREIQEKVKRLPELEKQLSNKENELKEVKKESVALEKSLAVAATKIKDMEDAVSKLLSKVVIPKKMVGHFMLKDPKFRGKIEEWGCREGALIKKNNHNVVKVNSAWLGFGVNGFIVSKLKQEGDNVVSPLMHVAKYVKLD